MHAAVLQEDFIENATYQNYQIKNNHNNINVFHEHFKVQKNQSEQ